MMRFTVVDGDGTLSFVGPCHALKALAAACSRGATDHRRLLSMLADYDALLAVSIRNGLTIFDEHNTPTNARAVHGWLRTEPQAIPPFRVVDDVTRNASLQPVRYGLVVFNLLARRIVQIQNSYGELLRSDRGRIRRDGKPTATQYRYKLPEEWSIVP